MITQFILDNEFGKAGTPVRFVDWLPALSTPQGRTEMVAVELPDGRDVEIDAGYVSSGIHSPEETLSVLSKQSGIREDTLLKAVQTGRLMARKSGATWLSTIMAIEYAVSINKLHKG